jgi:DNA-directed RNA polymerase subunit RPC12/RpoP
MKEFECKGCGTSVYISSEKNKDPVCPECRGVMLFVGNTEGSTELEKHTCPECKQRFFMKVDKTPYKCPFCNYTFSVSPRLKQKERL